MKIDAQWAELAMLKGPTQTLTRQIIGVEVEFVKFHDQQPLFCDAEHWPVDCCRRAVLARSSQSIDAAAPQRSAHQLGALILIASLYDLTDVSLDLLAHLVFSSVLAVEPLQRLIRERSRRLNFRAEGGSVDSSLRII